MIDRRNIMQAWNVAGIKTAGDDLRLQTGKKFTTNGIKVERICHKNYIAKTKSSYLGVGPL